MIRPPPIYTPPEPLFPSSTLFRSGSPSAASTPRRKSTRRWRNSPPRWRVCVEKAVLQQIIVRYFSELGARLYASVDVHREGREPQGSGRPPRPLGDGTSPPLRIRPQGPLRGLPPLRHLPL